MPWLPLALAAAIAFGLYSVLIKLGSERIDPVLGAFVLQLVAAGLGGAYVLWLRLGGHAFPVTGTGLVYAALAGAAVGLAEILAFLVFARGAPVAVASPILLGAPVLVAALIGVIALRERLDLAQVGGVLLIVAGVVLLASRP